MLEQDRSPDSETRQENLNELINAAAEAAERGETISDFLDHAALVSDSDAIDEAAPVTLMTMHNAKGLEFPLVIMTGLETGLFPHSRALMDSETALEEERRLCYVGMTRARRQLILTWAKYRRRYGGGEQERSVPSQFLGEIPPQLMVDLSVPDDEGEIDLLSERHDARQTAKRNLFTGKTYNSLDNISQFFGERGMAFKGPGQRPATPAPPRPPQAYPAPQKAAAPPIQPGTERRLRAGMTVQHAKYGSGTVIRREGEGEDVKITVNFQRYGLKKLIEKYAGLKRS